MRAIELEEGETPLGYSDNDDNVDPDKDFSYIDKKIEDVLGQYQRDFMGEVSAENLGARFGGYGSFLPAYQRSPSISTHPRNQSLLSSRSPRTMLMEGVSLNSVQVNDYASVGLVSSNDNAVKSLSVPGTGNVMESLLVPGVEVAVQLSSVPGTCSADSLTKCQSSGEYAANRESNCPPRNGSTQNSLKFRVKVVSDNDLPRDNSAIYSRLGLDVSPSASLEDSPSEVNGVSPSMQEMPEGSPSCIIEIMTSFHVPAGKLISPLRGSLLRLVEYKSNIENGRPGPHPIVSLSIVHETAPSRGETGVNRGKKARQKDNNMESVKMQKDNYEGQMNESGTGLMWSDGTELITKNEAVSKPIVNSFGGHYEGKNLTGLKDRLDASEHSFVSSGKGKVGNMEEFIHKSIKQVVKAKARELESDSVSFLEVDLEDRQRADRVGDMVKKYKDSSVARNDCISNEVNEDTDSIKPLKKHGSVLHSKTEEILNSVSLQDSGEIHKKEANRTEKIPKYTKASFPLKRDLEDGEACASNSDGIQMIKDPKSEPVESSMGNLNLKGPPSLQMEAVPKEKEYLSSGGRIKSKKSQVDGRLSAELPNLCSMVSSSPVQAEATSNKSKFPSKSRKDDTEPEMAPRIPKESLGEMDGEADFRKMVKVMEAKNTMHGPPIGGTQPSSGKLRVKAGGKGTGYSLNVGPAPRGDRSSANSLTEVASTSGAHQTENGLVCEADNWVLCDKCQKWRLLPYGLLPDCLPKKWICRMLDWLPGMNKCSFSEDETTNALLAQHHVSASVPEKQNVRPSVSKEGAPMTASVGNQHGDVPRQLSTLEAMLNGEKIGHGQQLQNFAENSQRYPKKLSQSSDDFNSSQKNGDVIPLKVEKKREADRDAYEVPKKVKRVLPQFKKEQSPAGAVPVGSRDGQNRSTNSSEVSKDFVPGISYDSVKKMKDDGWETVNAVKHEVNDVLGKKRKMMGEHHGQSFAEFDEWKERSSVVNNRDLGTEGNKGGEHMSGENKKRFKGSDSHGIVLRASIDARECRAGCKDNAVEDRPLVQLHGSNVSQKAVEGRKSSKDPELGLPTAVAATSDSSKLSGAFKVKVKRHERKSSPVRSISSSPLKVLRDHDSNGNKVLDLHNEPQEFFPVKRLKSVPHNENFRSMKPSTPRNSMTQYDLLDEDLSAKSAGEDFKQRSSMKHQSDHSTEKKQKFEVYKDAYRKSVSPFAEDRIDTSRQNLPSDDHSKRSLNHSDRAKSKTDAQSGSGRGCAPRHSQIFSTSEKRDELVTTAVHNADAKLPKQPGGGNVHDRDGGPTLVSLRHRTAEGSAAEINEASSSSPLRKDSSHNPDHLLKEAKELKHPADRLKKIVSIRETAVVDFQAALKFLIGASLSEPGGNEAARNARNSPDVICRSTGDLCENWAREFEKCNDMALAALAYKCMEVAYMRVVYSNNVATSRYQQELQKALRAVPQVDSPSSSASDVDNLNNQAAAVVSAKDLHLPVVHGNHVMPAGAMPNLVRLLSFAEDVSRAMEATRKSQRAFSDAQSSLSKTGNVEGISSLKRVLDFSFLDLGGFQRLVSLAMEALGVVVNQSSIEGRRVQDQMIHIK
ncbi:hypothetical protein Dimus_012191 [Dionaea muscipula]